MTIETSLHRLALREAGTAAAVPLELARQRHELHMRMLAEAAETGAAPAPTRTVDDMLEASERPPEGVDRIA